MDEDEKPTFVLFGRDVLRIPCVRSAFLYSISSYIGVGLTTFLFTSKPKLASHVGLAAFVTVSLGFYTNCRINYSRTQRELSRIQEAFHRAAVLEGSEVGRQTERKTNLEDV